MQVCWEAVRGTPSQRISVLPSEPFLTANMLRAALFARVTRQHSGTLISKNTIPFAYVVTKLPHWQ
jgi:hypothetical protein